MSRERPRHKAQEAVQILQALFMTEHTFKTHKGSPN